MDPNIQQDVTAPLADPAPERHCTHCGAEAAPSWGFCGTCGKPLGTSATPREDQGTDLWGTVVLADLPPAAVSVKAPASPPRRRRRSPAALTIFGAPRHGARRSADR